jgi:RNA binding exosome subunit
MVHSVEISTIAHATENLDKVNTALRFILPDELKGKEIFTRKHMQGHHGNPIITFDARLTKSVEVEQFLAHFVKLLSKNERLSIERDLSLYADEEGNLFIRVDKRQAFRGMIQLGDEDPIRIRLKFISFSGEATELMKRFLESE